jgi:S1-C subfamily serine protease
MSGMSFPEDPSAGANPTPGADAPSGAAPAADPIPAHAADPASGATPAADPIPAHAADPTPAATPVPAVTSGATPAADPIPDPSATPVLPPSYGPTPAAVAPPPSPSPPPVPLATAAAGIGAEGYASGASYAQASGAAPASAAAPIADPPPPARRSSIDALRQPFVGAMLVVLIAALGGAALAHFLWPSSPSSSSSSPFFGFTPNAGSGSGGGGTSNLFPSSGSGSGSGSGTVALPAADAAVTRRIDPGLVDIDTILGGQGGAAAGTGMVVSSNGEVITNNHVINGATSISAYDVGNGRTYTARVVGYDRPQDVAVLQLENASGLATVPLGDSSTVRVGATVVTIGNAGGVGGTPSAASGSVDALHRSITAGDSYEAGNTERLKDVIKINGSLEPGDSGGPLTSGGKVVGMDTAASSNFSFQSSTAGEGFAIPINQVVAISKQILSGQSTSLVHIGATALIGVYISNTSQCTNQNTGLSGGGSGAAGALVCGVVSNTPAAGTGLANSGTANAYDTITALAGKPVTSAQSLLSLMDTHHPGDRVVVTWVDASGASHSASLTLTTGPAD